MHAYKKKGYLYDIDYYKWIIAAWIYSRHIWGYEANAVNAEFPII